MYKLNDLLADPEVFSIIIPDSTYCEDEVKETNRDETAFNSHDDPQ